MKYAVGKKSLALCDRCGQQYRYLELRKEWNGLKVCLECYEPKHPQLEPSPPPYEPQALFEPRPDRVEPMVVPVGENVFNTSKSIHATTQVGIVRVVT
jgi:NAD-dependent SIR2 family protein deacetylase